MKKKLKRLICYAVIVLAVVSVFGITSFALYWNGSSTGGGGNGTSAKVNGYAIRTTGDNCIGYRFSIVNKNGYDKVGKSIDVFRNTEYGNKAITSSYKFDAKYNKRQIIDCQNGGFSTSLNSVSCYYESGMNFVTGLPEPSGMGVWQNYATNLVRILDKLGAGPISKLSNGDKILVEPIYDVKIEKTYHAVTVSEIALYGKYLLGAYSDGGASRTAESWGFISEYVNRHYPNALYTPDRMGLWSNASPLSSRAMFYTIINSGYGVGIAYTETKADFSPTLSVNRCEAWPGKKRERNNNHFGTSYGSSIANWVFGHNYPTYGDTIWYSVYFPPESENCYVKQTVSVVGGGSVSRNVYLNSNTWYDVSLAPTSISSSASYITVKARIDWIDSSGKVLKYGAEKSFYIPIKPKIYRYQVAAFNLTGNCQAYSGMGGSLGKVYIGQKVYTKFKYTSANNWTSYNNFYAVMQNYTGTEWKMTDNGMDVSLSSRALAVSSPTEVNNSYGYFRVADNRASGSNIMKFKLTSTWAYDPYNTSESNWIEIPVSVPDVELYELYIVDSDGYRADINHLRVAEEMTMRYVLKNNTDCTIFVNAYNNDYFQIPGIYEIGAGQKIDIAAYKFIVPNEREFTMNGSVYLEGKACGDASCESNPYNNTKDLVCKSDFPVELIPIVPNAPYREKTDVITSYYVKNRSYTDYYTANNLKVRFRVYNSVTQELICEKTKQIVVPQRDTNLVYFRWTVPEGLNGTPVKVVADLYEDGKYYSLVSNERNTVVYVYYNTPDTSYEDKAPDSFRVSSPPSSTGSYTTWYEYSCSGKSFTKTRYGVGIAKNTAKKAAAATGETAVQNGRICTMKSGYGVSLTDGIGSVSVSGCTFPLNNESYTKSQYAYTLLPEYNYLNETGKIVTLKKKTSGSSESWVFPDIGDVVNVHYTPIWYPDGDYTIAVVQSDAWTPMGMISRTNLISDIKISGNAYDDWSVGHK